MKYPVSQKTINITVPYMFKPIMFKIESFWIHLKLVNVLTKNHTTIDIPEFLQSQSFQRWLT